MKKQSVFLGMLAVFSLTLASGVLAQQPASPEQSKSASQSSQSHPSTSDHKPDALTAVQGVLLSTETILGSDVKNPQGQDVGDLKQLMLDPHSGRVMYAVVAMGGFLGMGEKTIIVPWNALEVARNGTSLVLNCRHRCCSKLPPMKGKEPVPHQRTARRWLGRGHALWSVL
jgi:sporulation protein YlmC with PRC-barrel domain